MATSDTLETGTFALINNALMNTNPDLDPINLKANSVYGNEAKVSDVSSEPTQGI